MDLQAEFERALAMHQQGLLLEAGEIYRAILGEDPEHVDSLNLMGVIMQAVGDLEMAEELLIRATELAPDYFAPFANLGNVLQGGGRLSEAVNSFRKALSLEPDSVETINNLASALNEMNNFKDALAASERALSLVAAFPEALVNKGNAMLGLGQAHDAVTIYQEALALEPNHSNGSFNLGNAYMDLEAFQEAIEPYRVAVASDLKNPEKHFNLGNALMKAGRFDDCLASFERALSFLPDYVDALCNLASALQSLGRTGEAMLRLQKALSIQPESPDLHWNLALAALQNGDYEIGWCEYEWRWKMPTFINFSRDFKVPAWDGRVLNGETVFIHTEQGFGDNLQFCRYIPMVVARGARVVLESRPELTRLLAAIPGVMQCINLDDAVPDCDYQIPLMSLPRIFGTTLESVPCEIPYISIPDGLIPDQRIVVSEGFKVGIAWAGSLTREDNHKRSLGLKKLVPLLGMSGVVFFSLQVGPGQEELGGLRTGHQLVDITDGFSDFADTAAAMTALDLIISVDTSVLHLAGALGYPAWGLMSQPTGFLWMNGRVDSPWYPTIRLFHQTTPGTWDNVVTEVRDALSQMVASRATN